MATLLFAMPPPQVILVWPAGFMLVLLLVGVYVTATENRGNRSERDRRAALGLMASLCGPLVGTLLAWLNILLGDVHPADVGYTYAGFFIIGGIAGLLARVAFGITGLISPRESSGKGLPGKSIHVTDEL